MEINVPPMIVIWMLWLNQLLVDSCVCYIPDGEYCFGGVEWNEVVCKITVTKTMGRVLWWHDHGRAINK